MNSKDDKLLAVRIWKKIFEDLDDRKGFSWWWDDIDEPTKSQIKEEQIAIIMAELLK